MSGRIRNTTKIKMSTRKKQKLAPAYDFFVEKYPDDPVEETVKCLEVVADFQAENREEEVALPTKLDEVWHKLILDTKEYQRLCFEKFGTFVHHRFVPKDDDDERRERVRRMHAELADADNNLFPEIFAKDKLEIELLWGEECDTMEITRGEAQEFTYGDIAQTYWQHDIFFEHGVCIFNEETTTMFQVPDPPDTKATIKCLEEEEPLKVIAITLGGKETPVWLKKDDTMKMAHDRISFVLGIRDFRLAFQGTQVATDDVSISGIGICDGDRVKVIERARGC